MIQWVRNMGKQRDVAEGVYIKEYLTEGEVVVAVCDASLIGKTINDGRIRLYIDPVFYGGKRVSIEEALEAIDRSSIANLVGKKIVNAAIKKGLVHPEAVIWIGNIPHAQIIKIYNW